MTTATALRARPSFTRLLLVVIMTLSVALALGIAVFGIADIATQLLSSFTIVSVRGDGVYSGSGSFTTLLPGSDEMIVGQIATYALNVPGLALGLRLLHALPILLTVLTQVGLVVSAIVIGRGVLVGRPFSRSVANRVTALAAVVLVSGAAAQLLTWVADNAILTEIQATGYSRALAFDPITAILGLALALVAAAFHHGARLQRDSEGLI